MTALDFETLKEAALSLPRQDRAALARDLLASLDGPADDDVAEAWDREIRRRIKEVESGEAKMVDAKEVMARVRDRLRG